MAVKGLVSSADDSGSGSHRTEVLEIRLQALEQQLAASEAKSKVSDAKIQLLEQQFALYEMKTKTCDGRISNMEACATASDATTTTCEERLSAIEQQLAMSETEVQVSSECRRRAAQDRLVSVETQLARIESNDRLSLEKERFCHGQPFAVTEPKDMEVMESAQIEELRWRLERLEQGVGAEALADELAEVHLCLRASDRHFSGLLCSLMSTLRATFQAQLQSPEGIKAAEIEAFDEITGRLSVATSWSAAAPPHNGSTLHRSRNNRQSNEPVRC